MAGYTSKVAKIHQTYNAQLKRAKSPKTVSTAFAAHKKAHARLRLRGNKLALCDNSKLILPYKMVYHCKPSRIKSCKYISKMIPSRKNIHASRFF